MRVPRDPGTWVRMLIDLYRLAPSQLSRFEARMCQNAKNLLGAHLAQNAAIGVQATGQRPKCIRMQGIGWGPPGQNTGNRNAGPGKARML